MDNADEIMNRLQKKYGAGLAMKGSGIKSVELERISTGSLSLDIECGGGMPLGRIIEWYGAESSGKTTMALKLIANVQKLGKKAVYIDVENTWDSKWAELMGVDIANLIYSRPETSEQAVEVLEAFVRSGDCGIVVLDSVAAMSPQSELEKSVVDDVEKIGERALLMNRAIRRLSAALNSLNENNDWNNCIVLLINQIRLKIGIVYGDPETTPGGMGIRFAASLRVRFKHGEWIEEDNAAGDKIKVGHVIKFLTKKNKTYSPYREGQFTLYFQGPLHGQVDTLEEIVRYGTLYDLIHRSGSVYTYEDIKANGLKNFVAVVRSDPKLVAKMTKEILGFVRQQ